jgi:predicted nucleic acid-binding Zn ribbon protein
MTARSCLQCGRTYRPPNKRDGRQFCSATCYKAARDAETAARNARTCRSCGRGFTKNPRATTKGIYCSRDCAFAARTTPERKAQKMIELRGVMERRNARIGKHHKVWFRVCVRCTHAYVARRLHQEICSSQCRHTRRPPAAIHCVTCMTQFKAANSRARYCSNRCRPKDNHASSRARNAGVPYESVNALRVLERDGWRCQICGKNTPKARRGTNYPNAPEVDHRVPLSRGGPHTYANVQCACRACNGGKNNKFELGQTPLFSAASAWRADQAA